MLKYGFIRQIRTNKFLLVTVICIVLGFLCIPAANDGYEIFYLGGVRGIYNSAWLGALAASLSTILLWLPGFYLLRSQISEDRRLKIGQIIAATPITKTNYIFSVFLTNFSILVLLELLFVTALMGMQLLRGEEMYIRIVDYFGPLFFITVPSLFFVAALTVVFDVVKIIKGSFGNIVIFAVWISFSVASVAIPNNKYDLFGIGMVLEKMTETVRNVMPGISIDGGSFGYYNTKKPPILFIFEGITWDKEFLISRFLWILVAFILVGISSLLFDRFKDKKDICVSLSSMKAKKHIKINTLTNAKNITLSPVAKVKHSNLISIVVGEFKIMAMAMPMWWYLLVLTGIFVGMLAPLKGDIHYLSVIMLLPFSIYSQMGCREKYYFTEDLINSSCSRYNKWIATWISGFIVSLIVSLGVLIHFVMIGDATHFIGWIVGILFVATLAIVFGSIAGNRKLFEAVYIAWFYFGPLNNMGNFDFLNFKSNNILFYLILSGILVVLGIGVQIIKEKR